MWKKLVALMMALCLLLSLVVSTFAAPIAESTDKTAVFLGDSLSAGFNMGKGLDAAYDFVTCLQYGTSHYKWAYPFQFGELVYGKDASPTDTEVNDNIFNYGLSGAKTADINALLHNQKPQGDEFNMLQQGFIRTLTQSNFYGNMRTNVGNADLVALTIGGNDIYHHFGSFQGLDTSTLGQIFYWLSQGLQYEMHFSQLLPLIEQYLQTLTGGVMSLALSAAKAGPEESTEESTMATNLLSGAADTVEEMLRAAGLGAILDLLDYYSGESVYAFFNPASGTSILDQWKEDYQGCVDGIKDLQEKEGNTSGQIALISLFNPFGIKNYIQSLRVRLESKAFQAALKAESTTALRVVKSLVDALDLAEKAETADLWEKMVINALLDAIEGVDTIIEREQYDGYFYLSDWWGNVTEVMSEEDFIEANSGKRITFRKSWWDRKTIDLNKWKELTPQEKGNYTVVNIGNDYFNTWSYSADSLPVYDVDDEDNVSLYDLLGELSFPLMAYMVGNGLQPLYDEMNSFIKSIADENPLDNIVYIDISDAPSNGRFDPHPHEMGHEWIAKSIYEQLCLINGGTAFKGYRGEAEDGSNIDLTRVTIRSIKTMVDAFIDLINGGGEASVKGQWAAAVTIMQQTQRLSSLYLRQLLL